MPPELSEIRQQYEEVLKELTNPELISDWEKMEELMRQKVRLEKIIAKEEELAEIQSRFEENQAIIVAGEPELTAVAEEEIKQLIERRRMLQKELEELQKGDEEKPKIKALIMEIRAGVGGEEAALFAADLYKMYLKYAQAKGWNFKVLDSSPTELGGYKEIVFEISGPDVYTSLQWEGGVHRVQRIPITEKGGRVHTSTCSVAVLPKPEKAQIKIRPDDLKIDTYRASGPGGQYVNRRETAVRITHLPTGIVVTSQTERNQLQNKENALAILEAKLLEKAKEEEEIKTSSARRVQIKQAKRAEKIRTYNFPQDRVTDHRIQKNFHNIEEIMEGKMEPIIQALQKGRIA